MSWVKHPRQITKHQFAPQTTVDGDRLDAAMADIVSAYNGITVDDIRDRWTWNRMVLGYSPQDPSVGLGHPFPWMDAENPEPGDTYQNKHRIKGWDAPDLDGYFFWSTSIAFRRPVIITRWNMTWLVDHPDYGGTAWYDADWTFSSPGAPGDLNTGDSIRAVTFNLHVDSEFDRENRALNDVVFLKTDFPIEEDTISYYKTPTSGFNPPWPNGYPNGQLHGLNFDFQMVEPIHQLARVRAAVGLPVYDSAAVGSRFSTVHPQYQQCYSQVITFLEMMV